MIWPLIVWGSIIMVAWPETPLASRIRPQLSITAAIGIARPRELSKNAGIILCVKMFAPL